MKTYTIFDKPLTVYGIPFFQEKKQLTRPAEVYGEEEKARREIVRATYLAAVASGDRHVYFIDGETLLGKTERCLCAVDGIHLNDLGFYRMATVIHPVLKQALETAQR